MSYEVKTEKMIERSASDVFRAIKEGRLFMNCGGDSRTLKIDFRVGGKYHVDKRNQTIMNFGRFLEIIPNKKVVFTWCQASGPDQKDDTQVSIELFEDGAKTRLVLVHSGFTSVQACDLHKQGWESVLTDFVSEVSSGRIRLTRNYKASAEKLFETCKNPASFFAFMGDLSKGAVDFRVGGKYKVPNENGGVEGEFLEIVPNKKVKMSWLGGCGGPFKGSQVLLSFNQKDDGTTTLELIHEGITDEEAQQAHRRGWEVVTEKMLGLVE